MLEVVLVLLLCFLPLHLMVVAEAVAQMVHKDQQVVVQVVVLVQM
jgi:hypothetical protein